jgi:hypothetical protein
MLIMWNMVHKHRRKVERIWKQCAEIPMACFQDRRIPVGCSNCSRVVVVGYPVFSRLYYQSRRMSQLMCIVFRAKCAFVSMSAVSLVVLNPY